jgi:adenylosuccinate lyase
MRRYGIDRPYERLKALTRGQQVNQAVIKDFVEGLAIPEEARRLLRELIPATYTGNAAEQARKI